MRFKNLIFALIGFTFLIAFSVYAGDDITKSDFDLTLCNMDPMRDCTKATVPGGKDALLVILKNFSDLLLFSIPLIAGISFIIAGYFYIFSSGDTEKANKGKTIIKWNIVAILVAFTSAMLVRIVASFFS